MYDPHWKAESILPNAMAIVGDKIIAGSAQGMVWFDPTPVSVREGADENDTSFRDDEMVRRQIIDLQGVVVYTDLIRGDQLRQCHTDALTALPTGMYLVHLSTASMSTCTSVIHVR